MIFSKFIFPVFFVPMLVLLGACGQSSGGFTETGNLESVGPEMDVLRGSVAIADGSNDAVTNSVTGQTQTLTYSIKNSGNAVLTVGSFALSTTTNCTASVTTQPSASVAAGQSNFLVVSVTPTAQGAWSCNISGSSNDADENPYNWTIQGTAQSSSMTLTSTTFVNGGVIPIRCSYNGGNVSPALTWTGAPSDTKSFVVIMDDPDAVPVAGIVYVHWNVFQIPAAATGITEGGPLPTGAIAGKNSGGSTGYEGVDPPSGTHHYTIAVYAMNVASVTIPSSAITRSAFETNFASSIISKAGIMGTYTATPSPSPSETNTN